MQTQGLDRFAAWFVYHKAKQLIGRAGFTKHDMEDLKQDLTLDLLQRLDQFDPKRAQWRTFVVMVVEHRVAAILEHRTAPMRDPCREQCSLNDFVSDHEGKVVERHETVNAECAGRPPEKPVDLGVDVQAVIAGLPARLQALCVHLQTKTVAEIVRELGIPRMTLYGDLRRIKAAFEKAGLGEYLPEK